MKPAGKARQHPPAGWVVPRLTLIVATLERSGSNFLTEMMTQTGVLGKPLEFLHPESPPKGLEDRATSTIARLHLAVELGATPNGVVAIKMFPDHMAAVAQDVRLSEWLGTPRWVWLRRRDLLAQAISLRIARQRNSYTSEEKAEADPVYSPRSIGRLMRRKAEQDAAWSFHFARTGITPLTLWYEDVERDPLGALSAIAAHAGIAIDPGLVVPGRRHKRQRDDVNEEWRRRFLEEAGDPDRFVEIGEESLRGKKSTRLGKLFGRLRRPKR